MGHNRGRTVWLAGVTSACIASSSRPSTTGCRKIQHRGFELVVCQGSAHLWRPTRDNGCGNHPTLPRQKQLYSIAGAISGPAFGDILIVKSKKNIALARVGLTSSTGRSFSSMDVPSRSTTTPGIVEALYVSCGSPPEHVGRRSLHAKIMQLAL